MVINKKNIMRVRIMIFICTVVLFGSAVGSTQQIDPVVYKLGQRGDDQYFVWVRLNDKQVNEDPVLDRHPVSEKAHRRRQLRGSLSETELAQLDRPVTLKYVMDIKKTGAKVRRVSRWTNSVSVEATAEQLDQLRQLVFVKAISPVRRLATPQPVAATASTSALYRQSSGAHILDYGQAYDQVNMLNVPAAHDQNYSGNGILVLMLDTGFFTELESISASRIVDQWDFVYDDGNTQNTSSDDSTYRQHDHGTGTYSVLGAYAPGTIIGPAYGCNFLLGKTEWTKFETEVEEDYYVAGLEWGAGLGADILSSSLGYIDWYSASDLDGQTAVTTEAVLVATRLGMVVVTAAGNEGRSVSHTLIAPADADSIITVGSVNSAGSLSSFSSYGPTADGRMKPEVVAQGERVFMAAPGTSSYRSSNGTSFSTPLVAGCVALVLEAHPDWTPYQVRKALMETASQANAPLKTSGWGIIDVLAAINYKQAPGIEDGSDFVAVILSPNPYTAGRGSPARIQWNFPGDLAVISIYDLLGREVQKLSGGTTSGSTIMWDGRKKTGQIVPAGIYFIKVATGREAHINKLIVQR